MASFLLFYRNFSLCLCHMIFPYLFFCEQRYMRRSSDWLICICRNINTWNFAKKRRRKISNTVYVSENDAYVCPRMGTSEMVRQNCCWCNLYTKMTKGMLFRCYCWPISIEFRSWICHSIGLFTCVDEFVLLFEFMK